MLIRTSTWSEPEQEIIFQDIFAQPSDVQAKLELAGFSRTTDATRKYLERVRSQQGYQREWVRPASAELGHTIVAMHDWHVPYHDPAAVEVAFKFCETIKPQVIIIHEVHDFYALSRFNKDPDRSSGVSLQYELDLSHEMLSDLVKRCPGSKIIMLAANHTDRLQKYLWSDAKGLCGLRALKLQEVMGLPELGIDYRDNYEYKGFLWKHGDIVRAESSYTAKNEQSREGTSGASGHTHRIGTYYTTKRGGEYVWVEGGCLADLHPEYIKGVANWQQGLSITQFEPEGSQFLAQAVPILKGKMVWGGRLISS